MTGELALARLHQHQEGVLAIMREAEPMLTDPLLGDVAGLARLRWTLMRALNAYQLFKHQTFFAPAIANRSLGEAHRAERMKRACTAMAEEFRGHVSKWSGVPTSRKSAANW